MGSRRFAVLLALAIGVAAGAAGAETLRLAMPEAMIAAGLDKHLLTRFRFKTRIDVDAVAEGAGADMALLPDGEGARVFGGVDGADWRLETLTETPERADGVAAFRDWLRSAPGKAAIEAFAPEGAALFTTEAAKAAVVEEVEIEGDVALGRRLALVHCGRCHVVDKRNRMGGIGSSPSFAALRGRERWSDLFLAFWSANPHPSFTQVEGITEPFEDGYAPHVAPVLMTASDLDAITAYVGTLEAKDLGRPIQAE